MAELNIAVVDDDNISLEMVAHMLEQRFSATVYTYSHPVVALDFIRKQTPKSLQLVISDLIMPRINGLELLNKTRESGIQVPFLFITSDVTRDTILKARRAGAAGFIGKPVSAENLCEKVRELMLSE